MFIDVPESPQLLKIDCDYLGDKRQQEALITWQQNQEYDAFIKYYLVQMNTDKGIHENISKDRQIISGVYETFKKDPEIINTNTSNTNWVDVYKEKTLNRDVYKLLIPLSPWVRFLFE